MTTCAVVLTDRSKRESISVKLEYDGTEPERAFVVKLEDAAGHVAETPITLRNCISKRVAIRLTSASRPGFDRSRVVKLRFSIPDVAQGERSSLELWGIGRAKR